MWCLKIYNISHQNSLFSFFPSSSFMEQKMTPDEVRPVNMFRLFRFTSLALRHMKEMSRWSDRAIRELTVWSEWFFLMLLIWTRYRFRTKSSLTGLHLRLCVATDHFRLTALIRPLSILTFDPGLQTNGVPSPRWWYQMCLGRSEISGSYSHCQATESETWERQRRVYVQKDEEISSYEGRFLFFQITRHCEQQIHVVVWKRRAS